MNRRKPCWKCRGRREIEVLVLRAGDCISDDLSGNVVIRPCPKCGDSRQPERPMPRAEVIRRQRLFWDSITPEGN